MNEGIHGSRVAVVLLTLLIAACGGGGGGGGGGGSGQAAPGGSAPPPSGTGGMPGGGSPGGGTSPTGSSVAPALQAQLAACPTGLIVNEKIPCFVGVFEGKTDTGAACAFVYDNDAVAFSIVGTQTVRAELNATGSGTTFEKTAASNPDGFSVKWAIGMGSGNDIDVAFRSSTEPASANGLFIKPKNSALPGCLVTTAPSTTASGATSTSNLLGRSWRTPALLNGDGNVGVLANQPAFDAGIADDGRAFVSFRQPDGSSRMAVTVVEGRPGASGSDAAATWLPPVVLDAAAPLLGDFRPRLAVSTTGHVVVMWISEQNCDSDAYQTSGKCRYLFASRRLSNEPAFEAPVRVGASPPAAAQDYYAQINFSGDIALVFPGFVAASGSSKGYADAAMVAIRRVDQTKYSPVELKNFNADPLSQDAFADRVLFELDDAKTVFAVGTSNSTVPDLIRARSIATEAEKGNFVVDPARDTGNRAYQLELSSGSAGYTWSGTRAKPARLTVYSPATQQWMAGLNLVPYSLWGDTALVGTDLAAGDLLIYSGCKVTSYVNGGFDQTRSLPLYCGRDRNAGVYAFNRMGDYVGLNWAGQPGQWGYYSRSQDKYLKGAPGSGATVSGDFVLGTPADVFGAKPTQLLLTSSGLALAVTTNTFIELPSAANPLGMPGGTAQKLWAVYLQ